MSSPIPSTGATPVAPAAQAAQPAAGQPQDPKVAAANPEQQAAEQAKQAEAKKAEVAALKKKFDLKVNGKSKAVEIDLGDDKGLQELMQKAYAADERFQESANMKKDVALLVKTLKENPLAILTHPNIGVDIKKLAEQVINQEIEDMQKSPEQRKLEQLEKELKTEREEREKIAEQARQAEIARHQEEQFRQIDDEITDAIASTDLPKVPYVVKRVSDAMISAFEMGYRDVSVKDIMPIVEKQLKEEMGQWFDSSKEDALESLLGKNLERIRKKRVAAQKALPKNTPDQVKPTAASAKPKEEPKEEKKTQRFSDVFGKF